MLTGEALYMPFQPVLWSEYLSFQDLNSFLSCWYFQNSPHLYKHERSLHLWVNKNKRQKISRSGNKTLNTWEIKDQGRKIQNIFSYPKDHNSVNYTTLIFVKIFIFDSTLDDGRINPLIYVHSINIFKYNVNIKLVLFLYQRHSELNWAVFCLCLKATVSMTRRQ